ncbi:FAD/NAD(P)-binding domain-containing protein [Artemisia annua]|uniref:FAD/NAD(P)-binding domain-containing protein n=1 Tax=Artemisia annua TaxID=35608 RepID=A0A2U1L8M6_ARTAN|nr:FAD/NAD(P)-binding domain-containing protein [Artemisia annua]
MSNLPQFDLIIIGAGIMGSSTAYHATKRGLKTLLLEQFDLLHYRGSSHGESRTIRATYPEAFYPPMIIESEKLWREAELDVGYNVYFKTEQLDFGPSDNTSLLVSVPEGWIAVVSDGGVLKATKAVAMFQTLAVKYGVVMKDKTEIADVVVDEEKGGVVVRSGLGEMFYGKKCVVTAGAWVSKLVKNVSKGVVNLPIQAIEMTIFYWRIKDGCEEDFAIGKGFPTFASFGEPYIYGTPALEFPDLIKAVVQRGRECDPDNRTWRPAEMVVEDLKEWLKLTFGDRVKWEDGPVMSQSCLYSMTPDKDYVIDFLGGGFGEDVVVAGGFSGHGFKMAPVVGRILVDLVVGGKVAALELDEEIKWFKIGRFEGNPRGNVKH